MEGLKGSGWSHFFIDNLSFEDIPGKAIQFLDISRVCPNGNWYYPLHYHDWYEIIFCTHGSGTLMLHNTPFILNAGMICVIKPRVFHSFISHAKGEFEYCVLSFQCSNEITEYFDTTTDCFANSIIDLEYIRTSFEMLEKLYKKGIYEKSPLYHCLCMSLLYYSQYSLQHSSVNIQTPSEAPLGQVLKYIMDHYQEPITLNSLSQVFSISISHLSRCFQQAFHISLINYIIDYRLCKAKEYLIKTDYSVAQIAELVGYSNCSYFSSLFSKRNGCSPLEYRTQFKCLPGCYLPPYVASYTNSMLPN